MNCCDRPLNLLWLLTFSAVACLPVRAQVVPDATLGAGKNSVTTTTGDRTDITGGLRRSSALFHSFDRFSIDTNRQVYFANPTGIRNIFSRVTGSSVSNIDGLLGVSGSANLFFMNPNGIIFGPNARLDVSGSFLATTANVLEFADGQRFAADGDRSVPLVEVNIPIGLQIGANAPAMLKNEGNLTAGQDLTLAASNLDLQGQLQAGGNLTLNATGTVKIRDTVTEPFLARSGNKLLVQGNQQVDIFALNHPASGLISGGDTVLRSANTIRGDAHFQIGGNFQIEQLNGNLGNLFSPFDPIVLAVGNVRIGNYMGASLHILAGGSVELGDIIINGIGLVATTINPNNANVIPGTTTSYSALSTVPLLNPDGTPANPITVDGNTQPTLDVRAGINWNTLPFTVTPAIATPTAFPPGSVTFLPPTVSGANISTGSITVTQPNGLVLLTNQFALNNALPANAISTNGDISTNVDNGKAGNVVINAGGNITTGGNIRAFVGTGGTGSGGDITLISRTGGIDTRANILFASTASGNGGDVTLKAAGNIFTGGTPTQAGIQSFSGAGGTGEGGDILLQSTAGEINTTQGALNSTTESGSAGDITIRASGDIRTGNVTAFSDTNIGGFSRIRINSEQGSVILNQASLTTSNLGTAVAGDILIDANREIQVTNNSQIQSDGLFGQILIGSNSSVDKVTITDSSLSATVPNLTGTSTRPGRIHVAADAIEVTNSSLNTRTSSTSANAGDISLTATGATVITNSQVTSITDAGAGNTGSNNIPSIEIQGASVTVRGNSTVDASTEGLGQGGNVRLEASDVGLVTVEGSDILTRVGNTATGGGGDITVQGGSISIAEASTEISTRNNNATSTQGSGDITIRSTSNSVNITNSPFITTNINGNGTSGDVLIRANQQVRINNGATVQTRAFGDTGVAGNIAIRAEAANGLAIRLENAAIDAASSRPASRTGSVTIEGANLGDVELIGQGFRPTIFTDTPGNQPTGDLTIFGGKILIDNYALNATVSSTGGRGGNILVNGDNITAQNGSLITAETSGGTGGNVTLQTTGGKIAFMGDGIASNDVGEVRTTVKSGATGSGGNVTIASNGGQIEFSNGFQVNSSTNTQAAPGRGGDVAINSSGGKITFNGNSAIDASTSGTQAGGNVSVASGNQNLELNSGSISTTTVKPTASADGGTITLTSNGGAINLGNTTANTAFIVNAQTQAINTTGSRDQNGKGGDVLVNSGGGAIAIVAGSQVNAGTTGTKDGGTVSITSGGGNVLLDRGSVLTTVEPSGSGNGGKIDISSGSGTTTLKNQATVNASTAGTGNANNVNLDAANLRLDNSTLLSGSTNPTSSAASGNIQLNTQQLTLQNKSTVSAAAAGTGSAGSVRVDANGSPADTISLTGGSSLLTRATGSGNAGSIALATRQLTLTDESQISGSTAGGQGESIDLTGLNRLQVTNSLISASTTGNGGRAGDVTVEATDSVTLSGTFNRASGGISTRAENGNGSAGQITISTPQLTVEKGAAIAASTDTGTGSNITLNHLNTLLLDNGTIVASTSSGVAGNLFISATGNVDLRNSSLSVEATNGGTAGDLSLQAGRVRVNQSKITVSSRAGSAGNLTLTTPDLRLDRGKLTAETGGSGTGANITIQGLQAPLILRGNLKNSSLISANATGDANGGNITIGDRNSGIFPSFIIGLTFENSDILANAERGNGGKIDITTNAIFGLQYRPEITDRSDITAKSESGASGVVAINTLNLDPSRGLTQLPTDLVDRTSQIAQGCSVGGSSAEKESRFTIAGRGGVQISPTALLPAQASTSDWVGLDGPAAIAAEPRFPDGSLLVLQPGQTYQIQTVCVNSWKNQQRSSL